VTATQHVHSLLSQQVKHAALFYTRPQFLVLITVTLITLLLIVTADCFKNGMQHNNAVTV